VTAFKLPLAPIANQSQASGVVPIESPCDQATRVEEVVYIKKLDEDFFY
jgi:hypothetical protein